MTARLIAVMAALALSLTAGAINAAAGWHSEQPLTTGSDVPVSLGRVYDIKFWAPNRGVLITDDGLWAYDGTGWRRLSTVCGGQDGRIAWAGPLDFWTISDQPVGQANPTGISSAGRSLCHFVNGAVVASYAQPLGRATSYQPMDAAACLAPNDCWFGGDRLPGTVNVGAFHLHWDGTSLTPWPSLADPDPSVVDPDRAISDMAVHQGEIYEAVRVDGNLVDGEDSSQPFLVHKIFSGSPPVFTPVPAFEPVDYLGVLPSTLRGFRLSSDGDTLWAAAGPASPGSVPAPPQFLRLAGSGLLPIHLTDDARDVLTSEVEITALAAEPGTSSAWVGYASPRESNTPARLARVHADGTLGDVTSLPLASDGIARKGITGPLACPSPGQCWMATTGGWLFHLGDRLPRDDAPEMHRLITYRPPDASAVVFPPDDLPDDDSGIAPPVIAQPPPVGLSPSEETPSTTKRKKLVTSIKKPKVRGLTLALKFTLTAKARVQLIAKRNKTVVAKTKLRTLSKGKHTLKLKLNRKRWPTALDLRAKAVTTSDTSNAGEVTISSLRKVAQ